MATEKPRASRPADKGDATLNTKLDAVIREQMDAYIADHNEKDEHHATLRSTVEAALKMYLKSKGFWPPKDD